MRIELDSRIDLRVVVHIFLTFFFFFLILNVWAISLRDNCKILVQRIWDFLITLSEFLCLWNFDALFKYCPLI